MTYYDQIKEELINNEINKKIKDYSKNRSDLITYYNVGKLLIEAGNQYGESIINQYSNKLTKELGKGYTPTNLRYMRQFYIFNEKYQTVSDKLTWSHYVQLLKLDDINKINYYINMSIEYNWSVRDLKTKIKNNEYERLSNETKSKLVLKQQIKVNDFIKNPIIIKNKIANKNIMEKLLKQLILEDLLSFMKELGDGFSFIDSEYKIKIGDRYNYIDLLLFNYIYNCFIVIELKITELKKEHIGQIMTYMNYIDKNVKSMTHDKTIGIIIYKKDNKFIMEYVSDNKIYETSYILN